MSLTKSLSLLKPRKDLAQDRKGQAPLNLTLAAFTGAHVAGPWLSIRSILILKVTL